MARQGTNIGVDKKELPLRTSHRTVRTPLDVYGSCLSKSCGTNMGTPTTAGKSMQRTYLTQLNGVQELLGSHSSTNKLYAIQFNDQQITDPQDAFDAVHDYFTAPATQGTLPADGSTLTVSGTSFTVTVYRKP